MPIIHNRLLAAALAAFLVLLGPAHAATLIYSADVPTTATDWTRDLSITKFNPNLGTLTSIEIRLTSIATTTITVSNAPDATSNVTGSVSTELQISLLDPASLLSAAGSTPQLTANIPNNPTDFDVAPGDSAVLGPFSRTLPPSNITYTLNDNPDILSEFTGSGDIILTGSTYTQTDFNISSGNAETSQVTEANLGVSITYNYVPIPEPATWALFFCGFGLAGLAILRRRRKLALCPVRS